MSSTSRSSVGAVIGVSFAGGRRRSYPAVATWAQSRAALAAGKGGAVASPIVDQAVDALGRLGVLGTEEPFRVLASNGAESGADRPAVGPESI